MPGAYEIPVVASAMARSGRFDAVVAIGTVVRPWPASTLVFCLVL